MSRTRPRLVMIGPAYGPRRDSFVGACRRNFGVEPLLLSWAQFCAAPDRLADALDDASYLRFETPDQDLDSLAALYARGEAPAVESGVEILPAREYERLRAGDIGSPTQLWFGLVAALSAAFGVAQRRGALSSVAPADCASAFDKTDCSRRLRAAGVATPDCLRAPRNFDDLIAAMEEAAQPRVFVKLRHGSAAAGMVALARGGDRWQVTTTAICGAGDRVYATRAVRRMHDRREIAQLIDRLARLGLHVEAWLPKIGIGGRVADMRVIVVDGEPLYPVLRSSRHPMTNLHLGGARGAPDAMIARIGARAWSDVLQAARAVAREFSSAHVLGVDIAVLADGRRHAVLEANVFGDFVKDAEVNGLTPHDAQLQRVALRLAARRTESLGLTG